MVWASVADSLFTPVNLNIFGQVGGWTLFIAGVVFLARKVSTGDWLPASQHNRVVKVLEDRLAAQEQTFEDRLAAEARDYQERLAEAQKNYDELFRLRSQAYETSYRVLEETFAARLAERSEVIEEARGNLGEMIKLFQAQSGDLSMLTRGVTVMERVLTAMDDALLDGKGRGDGEA